MISIGRTSSYAIAALSRLAQAGEPWMLASDLARATAIPKPYLSKLLFKLSKAGLIHTKRGYKGGYSLAHAPAEISVLQIVEAVEGPDSVAPCLLGREFCSDDRACPTHEFWKVERPRILDLLAGLTLEAVADFERNHQSNVRRGKRSAPSRQPRRQESERSTAREASTRRRAAREVSHNHPSRKEVIKR